MNLCIFVWLLINVAHQCACWYPGAWLFMDVFVGACSRMCVGVCLCVGAWPVCVSLFVRWCVACVCVCVCVSVRSCVGAWLLCVRSRISVFAVVCLCACVRAIYCFCVFMCVILNACVCICSLE